MREDAFWIGKTTAEVNEIIKTGLEFSSRGLICRSGGDLQMGSDTAYRILKNAVEFATRKSESKEGTHPVVACLRLPNSINHELSLPPVYRNFPIKCDPLDSLVMLHIDGKSVPEPYRLFKEGINPFLLIDDSHPQKYEKALKTMFLAAARFELGKEREWEVLVRQALCDATKDTNWIVRDSATTKFIKPLPSIFHCDPLRDKRTVDHMAKSLIEMSSKVGEVFKFVANSPIKTGDTESPAPVIDFMFSIEASWNITLTKDGRTHQVTQYQLGTHFGSASSDFFKAWKLHYGDIENIVWQNRRFAEVTANIGNKRRD
jgi:hypothetical protein